MCGDGECSQAEFPGFGRFGCTADCGPYTHLTRLSVEIVPQYETSSAEDQATFLSDEMEHLYHSALSPWNGDVLVFPRTSVLRIMSETWSSGRLTCLE